MAGDLGSFRTASRWVYYLPSTVRTVYSPGGAIGPGGEGGVNPGLALISKLLLKSSCFHTVEYQVDEFHARRFAQSIRRDVASVPGSVASVL